MACSLLHWLVVSFVFGGAFIQLSHETNWHQDEPGLRKPCDERQHPNESDPWVVFVHRMFSNQELCEGALLTPKWVLSVAHCLSGQHSGSLKVLAGGSQIRPVESLIIHPRFDHVSHEHDLALLTLRAPFQLGMSLATVCPATSNQQVLCTESCRASAGSTAPRSLDLMPHYDCRQMYRRRGSHWYPRDSMDCLRDTLGTHTQCLGNSGTTLTCLNNRDRRVLVGLLSLGWNCVLPSSPAIFTKVSSHYDWISSSVNEGDFDLLLDCSRKSQTQVIKGVREDEEGLHIDVFIPKSKSNYGKNTPKETSDKPRDSKSTDSLSTPALTPDSSTTNSGFKATETVIDSSRGMSISSSANPNIPQLSSSKIIDPNQNFDKATSTNLTMTQTTLPFTNPTQTVSPDVNITHRDPHDFSSSSTDSPDTHSFQHGSVTVTEKINSTSQASTSILQVGTHASEPEPPVSFKSLPIDSAAKQEGNFPTTPGRSGTEKPFLLLKMSPDNAHHKRGYNIYIRQDSSLNVSEPFILKLRLHRV